LSSSDASSVTIINYDLPSEYYSSHCQQEQLDQSRQPTVINFLTKDNNEVLIDIGKQNNALMHELPENFAFKKAKPKPKI
jgi:hypothetical protein